MLTVLIDYNDIFCIGWAYTYIFTSLSWLGQIAIASTVFVSSFSSTALLQIVAHPYVSRLYEILPDDEDSNDQSKLIIDSSDHKAVISNSNTSPTVTTISTSTPATAATTTTTTISTSATSTTTSASTKDHMSRRFIAIRYNMLGNDIRTEFTLRDASRNVSNPFSSFQVNATNSSSSSNSSGGSRSSGSSRSSNSSGGYFYIYGGDMTDTVLKNALTKENY